MSLRILPLAWLIVLLGLAIAGCKPAGTAVQDAPATSHAILGAGATFPAELYKKWTEAYAAAHPDAPVSYEAVGSGEGVKRFISGSVDFGASDAAMSDEEMARVERGVQLIPATAGSIVLAYNVPGVEDGLKLSREVYVDIFLGKIEHWNDPRIAIDNPDLTLPDDSIVVAARQDSSGTTYAFTNHLSAVSKEWSDFGPGVGKVIDWPGSAMLARGNEGVATLIQRNPGTIGYVEFGVASRAGVHIASIQNKAGKFVSPTSASGMATLVSTPLPANLRAFFPDPDGDDSYPIVTYTWLLLYGQYPDADRAEHVKAFVKWGLTEGQQFNESLGFIRLPPDVADQGLAALDKVK